MSESEIVEAAVLLAQEGGLSRLSMRAVARALSVPPMTLYGYVPNKEALHVLVIDRILQEVRVPPPASGSWETRLRVLLCDARQTLMERPQLAEDRTGLGSGALQLLHKGMLGHEASRLADAVIDLLRDGGFHTDDLHTCFVTLFTYVTGYADNSEPMSVIPATPASRSSAATFELGIQALIEGLRVVLRPQISMPTNLGPGR